jgi:hypothetical protein
MAETALLRTCRESGTSGVNVLMFVAPMLRAVLTYHVVAGRVTAADASALQIDDASLTVAAGIPAD